MWIRLAGRTALVGALLVSWQTAASDPAAPAPAACGAETPDAQPCPARTPGNSTWADTSYQFVTTQSDSLANWIDSFFGSRNSDVESADSVLRLLGEVKWDQEDGTDQKLRLRGKVDLPRLSRKLSLVFSEDDDERRDVLPDQDRKDSDIGLVYRVAQQGRARLYASVGTNSSLEFRSSLRYRYDYPFSERWHGRFSERLYYKEDDGFGTLTRGDLDFSFDDNHVIRWTTDVEYGEETAGTEWGGRLSYFDRMNEKEVVNFFAAVSGETDPEAFTDAYSLGVRYRRNIWRPWVFVEVEPSHVWRKEDADQNRSSAWVLTFRVELREELDNHRSIFGGDSVRDAAR